MTSTERAQSPWWEPTWRRIVGSTVVLFVVILAFLVGRVRAGTDPGLPRSAAPATQSAPPAVTGSDPRFGGGGSDPQSQGVDPNDPFGRQADPGAGGTTGNFGNAVPGTSSGTQQDQGDGTQQVDPPSTHVS